MRVFSYIVYGLFGIILLLVVGLFAMPSLPYLGHMEVKIVKSGSMEPSIMTGGIVVVRRAPLYSTGDVITFESRGSDIPTTHRIIGTEEVNGQMRFVTKGDANEERDIESAAPSAITGKVLFTVPYLGFVIDFARQPVGFALLIGLPALLIVMDEMTKIFGEIKKRRKHVVARVVREVPPLVVEPYVPTRGRAMDIRKIAVPLPKKPDPRATPPLPLRARTSSWASPVSATLVALLVVISTYGAGDTISYFNDQETSAQNSMRASALGFSAAPVTHTISFEDTLLETPDESFVVTLDLEDDSVPLLFTLTTSFATGTTALCDAVVVESPDITYDGSMSALQEEQVALTGSLTLDFNLSPGAYAPGDTCVISLRYDAWSADQGEPIGYDDAETTTFTFVAPPLPPPPVLTPFDAGVPPEEAGTTTPPQTVEESSATTTEEEESEHGNSSGDHPHGNDGVHENNGHGNDGDHNDDSNPGASNDEADTTDDEAVGDEAPALVTEEPSTEEETEEEAEEEPAPEPEINDTSQQESGNATSEIV